MLLDTHTLIWLLEGAGSMRRDAVAAIDGSAADDALFVPVVVFWEIGMLDTRGRIRLEEPFADWLGRAQALTGFSIAPMTAAIAFDSTRLPGRFHRDPADRFIVATARAMGATLVTRDRQILRYADQGHVRAMAA